MGYTLLQYQFTLIKKVIHLQSSDIKSSNYNKSNNLMSTPPTSTIKINSELIKKIKQLLQSNPTYDQDKVTDVLQGDQSLRLKKQVIKSGVQQYFRKYIQKPSQLQQKEPVQQKPPIDLTLDQVKKKKKPQHPTFQFEDHESYNFQLLGGIQQVMTEMNSTLFQFVHNKILYKELCNQKVSAINKGFLITGSVGSGKTKLANCILSELKKKEYACFMVSAYELMGNDADDKLKKVFESMEEKAPAALCIDNIEEICSKEANKRPNGSSLSTLCLFMDKCFDKEFIFIATSSSPQKLDILTKPGRFYKPFKLPNPTEQQRLQIFTKSVSTYQHKLSSQQIQQIISLTSGFVAVDIISLIQESMNKCVKRIVSSIQSDKCMIFEDFVEGCKQVQPVLKREGFAKIPTTKLDDIGALEHIKEALINQLILPMKKKDKFKKLNFEINGGGVLLYGPPGCGKTMLAKGIANQANVNFITVKGPQLLTKYVGESQQAVRKVFERARSSAPSVIFFDEFDALAPKRQDSGNQVTQRVVNTLLNELNGIDDRKMIFVIAATNRPDIIDQAVLRSGRIQLKLEVPMPNQADREQILKKLTSKVSKQQQIDATFIAEKTEKFSGADLAYLVKKSIISAVATDREGINNQDLLNAIESFKKDNVFGKKPEMIQEQQEKEDQQFAYHPEQELKPKKMRSDQSEGIDNEMQKNIRLNKDMKNNAEGILSEFIGFLVQKSKNGKTK